jgi:hypothetical protein
MQNKKVCKRREAMILSIRKLQKVVLWTDNKELFLFRIKNYKSTEAQEELLWGFYLLITQSSYVPLTVKLILKQGMTYAKASKIIGSPIGTVNTRVYQFSSAMDKTWGGEFIGRLLQGEMPPEECAAYTIQVKSLMRTYPIDPNCIEGIFPIDILLGVELERGAFTDISDDRFNSLVNQLSALSTHTLRHQLRGIPERLRHYAVYLMYAPEYSLSKEELNRKHNLISRCTI